MRLAAEQRVAAMELSDAWVAAGCRMDDPLLAAERLALVTSYAALREGSERAAAPTHLSRAAERLTLSTDLLPPGHRGLGRREGGVSSTSKENA